MLSKPQKLQILTPFCAANPSKRLMVRITQGTSPAGTKLLLIQAGQHFFRLEATVNLVGVLSDVGARPELARDQSWRKARAIKRWKRWKGLLRQLGQHANRMLCTVCGNAQREACRVEHWHRGSLVLATLQGWKLAKLRWKAEQGRPFLPVMSQ